MLETVYEYEFDDGDFATNSLDCLPEGLEDGENSNSFLGNLNQFGQDEFETNSGASSRKKEHLSELKQPGNEYETLFNHVKKAMESSGALDEVGGRASLQILKNVLQQNLRRRDRFIQKSVKPKQDEITCDWFCSSAFVPREVKDLWGISPLGAYIAYEDESGRVTQPFKPSVGGGTYAQPVLNYESDMGSSHGDGLDELISAHPTGFVSYGFSATMLGLPHLEEQARNSWAAAISAPISIDKRYSEFVFLHNELSRKYKYRTGLYDSRVKLLVVPSLPSKHAFLITQNATNQKFVQKRRLGLQVWLEYVSLHGIMNICEPFRRFVLEPSREASVEDDTSSDSFSVISSSSTYLGNDSVYLSSSSKGRRSSRRNLFADDPVVINRARKQIQRVRAKYGSGPVALHIINGSCSMLMTALDSCLLATRRLIGRENNLVLESQTLASCFLSLWRDDKQIRSSITYGNCIFTSPRIYALGLTLSHENRDEVAASMRKEENQELIQQSLKFWTRNILPRFKHLGTRLYSTNFEQSRQEEKTTAQSTPSERLAAEWFENSQVRCCMIGTALEDFVKAHIDIAVVRRRQWESLKQLILDDPMQSSTDFRNRDSSFDIYKSSDSYACSLEKPAPSSMYGFQAVRCCDKPANEMTHLNVTPKVPPRGVLRASSKPSMVGHSSAVRGEGVSL